MKGHVSTTLPREFSLCRELFGIIQSLATRPISVGNELAIIEAQDSLIRIMNHLAGLERGILKGPRLRLVEFMLKQAKIIPIEVVAKTLLGSLQDLLGSSSYSADGLPTSYLALPEPQNPLQNLVIAVGPTIGVGDEVLLARSLVERAQAVGGVRLRISSRRYHAWACQSGPTEQLGQPPLGCLEFLEGLSLQQRSTVAYVFLDFLLSDPSALHDPVVDGLGYAGRWFMGLARGDFIDFSGRHRYELRYPDGMPACRWLESRWAAIRILPARTHTDFKGRAANRHATRRDANRVVLQPLTSKPSLMLPPTFYAEVLRRVCDRLGRPLKLEIIPNPTTRGGHIVAQISEAIQSAGEVELVQTGSFLSLCEVFERLGQADLLFGPDTFTAHLADLQSLPQVAIVLPEHIPWITPGSPRLSVELHSDLVSLAKQVANRILAYLKLSCCEKAEDLKPLARRWCCELEKVDRFLTGAMEGRQGSTAADLRPQVRAIQAIYLESTADVCQLLGDRQPEMLPAFCGFDPITYVHPEDAFRALTRWYQSVSICDVGGILRALQQC